MKKIIDKIKSTVISYLIKDHKNIDGFLSDNEAIALYKYASKLSDNNTIVEIGCWKGKSTYCLAKGLSTGNIIVIDPFDASGDDASKNDYENKKGDKPLLEQFKKKMEQYKLLDKIIIMRGLSNDFVGQIKKINMLFIDGNHSKESCEFDYINYSFVISSGGFLLLHDFYESRKELGPTWVVNNIIIPSRQYDFIGLHDSLWVARKR